MSRTPIGIYSKALAKTPAEFLGTKSSNNVTNRTGSNTFANVFQASVKPKSQVQSPDKVLDSLSTTGANVSLTKYANTRDKASTSNNVSLLPSNSKPTDISSGFNFGRGSSSLSDKQIADLAYTSTSVQNMREQLAPLGVTPWDIARATGGTDYGILRSLLLEWQNPGQNALLSNSWGSGAVDYKSHVMTGVTTNEQNGVNTIA